MYQTGLSSIALIFVTIYVSACSILSDADNQLVMQEDLLTQSVWQKTAFNDAYNGEWIDVEQGKIYEFFEDHRFKTEIINGCCTEKGSWQITEGGTQLELAIEDDSISYVIDFEIRDLSDSVLAIAWMGRHGPVIERYEPKD